MTALGMFMVALGVFISAKWGSVYGPRRNLFDHLGSVFFNIGCLLILLGVLFWVWQVAP